MNLQPEVARWSCLPISRIEDLSDGIHGAGLDAMQMSRGPVVGSLAFATHDDVTYNTGYIDGHVALSGPLSQELITLGLGVDLPAGAKQWLKDIPTGAVGVFLPGDVHDSMYFPGSLYATATLSRELLEQIAARAGLVLGAKELSGTGIAKRSLSGPALTSLQTQFRQVHQATPSERPAPSPATLGRGLLEILISELGRSPRPRFGAAELRGHGRIIARARIFICENLHRPLSIDMIAAAVFTSHRTLHRAFLAVLNETPYSYVQRVRLHRIRHELISSAELCCTITCVANNWGITELGRFAGWYREQFGELPSQTLARHRHGTAPFHHRRGRLAVPA
jgi:AraC-like DNA-binding protein